MRFVRVPLYLLQASSPLNAIGIKLWPSREKAIPVCIPATMPIQNTEYRIQNAFVVQRQSSEDNVNDIDNDNPLCKDIQL
jgi:hypothetical protein